MLGYLEHLQDTYSYQFLIHVAKCYLSGGSAWDHDPVWIITSQHDLGIMGIEATLQLQDLWDVSYEVILPNNHK